MRTSGPAAWRRILVGVAVLSLTGAGVTLASGAATAAPAGQTLTGTVTAAQTSGPATPASDAYAALYSLTGTGGTVQVQQRVPVNSGSYSFSGVAPGRYRVFLYPSFPGSSAATWIGSPYESSSTAITVANTPVALPDAELPLGGSISGTVATDPTSLETYFSNRSVVATAYLVDPVTRLLDDANKVSSVVNGAGAYTLSGLVPGDYVVRVSDTAQNEPEVTAGYYPAPADDLFDSTTVTVPAGGVNVPGINVTVDAWPTFSDGSTNYFVNRYSGADRYNTATTVSSTFFTRANVVFIASGENYPDALGASAAAAWAGGPLLLVPHDSVPAEVTAEIERLSPPKIVVVGGTSAIDASVYSDLATLVPAGGISRISGTDRYDTSRLIAASVFGSAAGVHSPSTGVVSPTAIDAVFIATGQNYPDALVSGGAAGFDNSPLLLVNGSASSLDAPTTSLLRSLAPKRIYIIGGDSAVSPGVESALDAIQGVPTVLRLSGADRFATADAVNEKVFPFADSAFLATAYGFADALSISAVSGAIGSPLYLSQQDCIPDETWESATNLGTNYFQSVGGPAALSDNVAEDLVTCSEVNSSKSVTSSDAQVRAGKPALQLPLSKGTFRG
jgi:putative cell wall-binding protein